MTSAIRDGPLPTPDLTEASAAALLDVLEPGEGVEQIALAVGCCLVLTERRLLLVREGADHRPKTGIGSWPTDERLRLHLEAGAATSARTVQHRQAHAFACSEPVERRLRRAQTAMRPGSFGER